MTDSATTGSNQLRKNSLGLIAVTFMVVSAAAPLTGVAGAVPIAFLLGNGTGVPATFLFMTIVMLLFAVGYVAMSRHVSNAGAFYAYAARGLGGGAGGAVSMIAIVAYAIVPAIRYTAVGLMRVDGPTEEPVGGSCRIAFVRHGHGHGDGHAFVGLAASGGRHAHRPAIAIAETVVREHASLSAALSGARAQGTGYFPPLMSPGLRPPPLLRCGKHPAPCAGGRDGGAPSA